VDLALGGVRKWGVSLQAQPWNDWWRRQPGRLILKLVHKLRRVEAHPQQQQQLPHAHARPLLPLGLLSTFFCAV
jgi:hypothetical protein